VSLLLDISWKKSVTSLSYAFVWYHSIFPSPLIFISTLVKQFSSIEENEIWRLCNITVCDIIFFPLDWSKS
jgi:hypothetical protein